MYTKTRSYRIATGDQKQLEQDITVSGFVASLLMKVILVIIAALLVRVVFPASPEGPTGSSRAGDQIATNARPLIEQDSPIGIRQSDSALYSANPELQAHHRFVAARDSINGPELLPTNSPLKRDPGGTGFQVEN
jgi:hypothetical protein